MLGVPEHLLRHKNLYSWTRWVSSMLIAVGVLCVSCCRQAGMLGAFFHAEVSCNRQFDGQEPNDRNVMLHKSVKSNQFRKLWVSSARRAFIFWWEQGKFSRIQFCKQAFEFFRNPKEANSHEAGKKSDLDSIKTWGLVPTSSRLWYAALL